MHSIKDVIDNKMYQTSLSPTSSSSFVDIFFRVGIKVL